MFNVALKQQAGNSVSKWVASSRRSLISFRVSRHRITNTSTGMQSSTKRLIRFSRESISRESHSEAFSHSRVHLRKGRRHWHGRMLDTVIGSDSPRGAEQRKSARFQPVATAMTGSPQSADIPESRCHVHDRTAACLSPYAGLAFPPRTRGSARLHGLLNAGGKVLNHLVGGLLKMQNIPQMVPHVGPIASRVGESEGVGVGSATDLGSPKLSRSWRTSDARSSIYWA